MRFPHVIIYNAPKIVAFFGRLARRRFACWTIFCFTFVDDAALGDRQRLHEYRHVMQFFWTWPPVLLLCALLGGPLWVWVLSLLFAFTVVYLLASASAALRGRHFYRDNWFERDARRYAGEPL